ncbi:MAG: thiolase family protein [Deltaproteobacteria bacterium]|nr:thiolase family protein [Deltaproteobacteria bacterium]
MSRPDDVVVVSAVRTAFGRFGGALRGLDAVKLGEMVIREAVQRAGVKPQDVDKVVMGLFMPRLKGIAARCAALDAGLEDSTRALTVDRACCSAMTALGIGFRDLKLGLTRVFLGGGMENMSRTPYLIEDLRWGKRMGDVLLEDRLVIRAAYGGSPLAVDAGEVALEHGIGRQEQDEWALRSQTRYAEAHAKGKFDDEIMPTPYQDAKGKDQVLTIDEQHRPGVTLDKLAKLKTVYNSPSVTPGNAPGLNDGASAAVIVRRKTAQEMGLQVLGQIVAYAEVAGPPRMVAAVPAEAVSQALDQAGLGLDDVDLIEINEAFAAMPLVSTHILGQGDKARIEKIRAKTNVNGDAIAIGHPTAASGARVMMHLLFELRRRGGGIGCAAICGGASQGDAMIVKVD